MNYRAEVAAARRQRDRAVSRAQVAAREAIAQAAASRDAEIHRLRSEGNAIPAIAALVGCSVGQAYEIVNPDRREAYNARRKKHARRLHAMA